MAVPAVEELWSLTVWSKCWVMLGMLEHTVVGKSMIPHRIPSVLGLLLETPQTLQQPWGGCLVGEQEIGVPRRAPVRDQVT